MTALELPASTRRSRPSSASTAVSRWGRSSCAARRSVGRFVADAEAIYSYEGTREINTLIVGRAITGESAFV